MRSHHLFCIFFLSVFIVSCNTESDKDKTSSQELESDAIILPSWNDTKAKSRIVDFVELITDSSKTSFIPRENRIAVFDNDGTLWSEQPLYFQLLFAIDRVKEIAGDHPDWKDRQPMKAVLENDMETLKKAGTKAILDLVSVTHAGVSEDEFNGYAKQWADTAKHPQTGKRYIEMVYAPMLELLDYLEDNGFKNYIVSGGGVSFMRAWAPEIYGIPSEQILGSTLKTSVTYNDSGMAIMRTTEIDFIDDREGKPENINRVIGKVPVIAFGNSDGDLAMLKYTTSGGGPRLAAFIHHTDSVREYAYDRDGHIGVLDEGMDEAKEKGWLLVDMEKDWKTIYPE